MTPFAHYEPTPEWDCYALACTRLEREIRLVRNVSPRSPHPSTAAQRQPTARPAAPAKSLAA